MDVEPFSATIRDRDFFQTLPYCERDGMPDEDLLPVALGPGAGGVISDEWIRPERAWTRGEGGQIVEVPIDRVRCRNLPVDF